MTTPRSDTSLTFGNSTLFKEYTSLLQLHAPICKIQHFLIETDSCQSSAHLHRAFKPNCNALTLLIFFTSIYTFTSSAYNLTCKSLPNKSVTSLINSKKRI